MSQLLPLLSGISVEDFESMVQAPKQANMAKLKDMGVESLQERQKVANCLSKAKRTANGQGMPVLVVLYGSGLSPETGTKLCSTITSLAANPWQNATAHSGFAPWTTFMRERILVLHPFDASKFDPLEDYDQYIDALVEEIDGNAERRGRPVLLVAHSFGTNAAHHLAARLGNRVRHLTVIAGRGPAVAEDSQSQMLQPEDDSDEAILKWSYTVWKNEQMAPFVKKAASEWPDNVKGSVAQIRKQFFSKVALSMHAPSRKVTAPILAIAASKEPATGETAERMQSWAEVTTGIFQGPVTLDDTHMGVLGSLELVPLLKEAWLPTLRQGKLDDRLPGEDGLGKG